MLTATDILEIKEVQKLLEEKLSKTQKSIYLDYTKEYTLPILKDRVGLKRILGIIQTGSNEQIRWEERVGPRGIPHTSAGDTDIFTPRFTPAMPLGIDISVGDPAMLKQYFEEVFRFKPTKSSGSLRNLVEKDEQGNYLYNGKTISISKNTIPRKILDILLSHGDREGFVSYQEIDAYLAKEHNEDPINDPRKRNARIFNAITNNQQGLFHSAKIGTKKLPNETLKGGLLIEVIRGKGLKLNNPAI